MNSSPPDQPVASAIGISGTAASRRERRTASSTRKTPASAARRVRSRRHGDDIDPAMKGGCNFPMGPFALLDLVGLDTSVAILDALYVEFKEPNYTPVPSLRRMVEAGLLGRKSGRGFYDYRG